MLLYTGILCGLAIAAFGALASRPAVLVVSLAAFAAGLVLLPDAVPGPAAVGTLTALAAGAALLRPRLSPAAAACGGVLAAVLGDVIAAQDVPVLAAHAAALLPLLAAATLAARLPRFAPVDLEEEALALVTVLALGLAAAPAVVEGFASALALRAVPLPEDAAPVGHWALALGASFALLGGFWALWRRR